MTSRLERLARKVGETRAVIARKLRDLARALDTGAPPEDVSDDLKRTANDLQTEFADLAGFVGRELADATDDDPCRDDDDEMPFVPGREGDHR